MKSAYALVAATAFAGGALERMILPFKMFAGGPIAPGTHHVTPRSSWARRSTCWP